MAPKRAIYLTYGNDESCAETRQFLEEAGVVLEIRDLGKNPMNAYELMGILGYLDAKRFAGGSIDLQILSDGTYYQDAGAVFGVVPRVMCADYYQGLMHPGGAFMLNVMMTWGMRTNGRTGQSIDYHNWTEAFRALPLTDLAGNAGRAHVSSAVPLSLWMLSPVRVRM